MDCYCVAGGVGDLRIKADGLFVNYGSKGNVAAAGVVVVF